MKLTDFSQHTPLVSRSLESVTPGRALDAGSFEGQNALFLARLGLEVVAIDIDEESIATLQKSADAKVEILAVDKGVDGEVSVGFAWHSQFYCFKNSTMRRHLVYQYQNASLDKWPTITILKALK